MFHDPDFMPFTPEARPTFRSAVHNFLATWPVAAYREGFSTIEAAALPFIPRSVYLTDPDLIEDVLITRADFFVRDQFTVRAMSTPVGKDSLFFAEGADWRWQRRAVAPAFRHEALLRHVPTFAACAKEQAEAWRVTPPGGPVDVAKAMTRTTFSVIEKAVLGESSAYGPEIFLAMLEKALANIGWRRLWAFMRAPRWLPYPGFLDTRAALRYTSGAIEKTIAARRSQGRSRGDVLALLLSAKDPETGRVMTDAELGANLDTFIIAGHETAAVALSWSLWLLAKDQASQERLRAEVREIAGDRTIGAEEVERLQFTKQVLQESMRLFPPAAGVGRQAREDTMIGPHKVLASEPIFVATWCLHRRESFWDEPNGFEPDRFTPEKVKARHRCAYLPFGAGPRICIGMNFAMLEMTTILATLIRDFRFETVPGHRLELAATLTTRARGGLPLIIRPL